MRNPYVSIFSTQNLPEKTKELRNFWEFFVSNNNSEIVPPIIRNNILASWKRCQENGISPQQSQTKPALSHSELTTFLMESEIYKTAKPIMDDLFYKITGTGYLAALSDQNGKLIYLKGDPVIISEAEKMNFAPGMDWSEQAAGTNAIGTSIVTKNPIQIFSAEHFCLGCHPWTCSSAPITHPFTKEIIGAIDFTGLWDLAQPHTLGLAISVAKAIEMELAHGYFKLNQLLTECFYKAIQRWKNDHILILDLALSVVNGSEKLMEAFKVSLGSRLKDHSELLLLAKELISLAKCPERNLPAKEFIIQNFTVIAIERIVFSEKSAGYLVVFKDIPKISPVHSPTAGPWAELIVHSNEFRSALVKCQKAASSSVPILILGESGTGKENIAKLIHKSSHRADKPFIAINCGAIQKELISSELFGYESGTFTGGAKDGKKGKFEEANGGTLFLDEIGEMPLDLQVHLLRVLQEKEIIRLGSSKTIPVNVRVVAATNKNVYDLCQKGLFREDLLFRLNVVSVTIPPLRERKEDIFPLCEFYLNQFVKKYEKISLSLNEETLNFFYGYTWPGNIRELQNVLEHAVIFSESNEVNVNHLPSYLTERFSFASTNIHSLESTCLEDEEQKLLIRFLEETNWNLTAVAKKMKIARTTLYRKLKKHKLYKQ
jgi:transcriptional regulator of acetoin/glycerol metabolism